MRSQLAVLVAVVTAALLSSCDSAPQPRVLVFSKTAGFRHESIDSGKVALVRLGASNGFIVDTTEDAAKFTEESLKAYAAVVFLNTTGNILDRAQEVELQRFIQAGGGFVGIHAAADAEYDWPWYGRMVGAYFDSHPAIQQATLRVADSIHQSTAHLPSEWLRTDEWYNFRRRADSLNVLLHIDESSYTGGAQGNDHPMAWYHAFEGGRAWYTALGHTVESYSDTLFLRHVLGGIRYAIGDRTRDYRKAVAQRPPADSLFTRTVMAKGEFNEPTEMAILPNGDVLVAERGGVVRLVRESDGSVSPVATLSVYSKSGVRNVNAEEGLLGLTLDPDFASNRYLYLFYSPADTSVNRLSRFVFDGDSVRLSSEKVVLEFYSQRRICCHTGGSLAFGPDRTLFLSTGDNTTPFDEARERFTTKGFAPIDDRPGHEQYDARRTSANTNDLRGKILRIRIDTSGNYTIPDGNLFAPDAPGARPEIYVMGNRNPYRISVDAGTGFLYWGEVGPDAADDSLATRGPRGYDEINQARRAGNFGWPMFVGANLAYFEYDYKTGTSGARFDPARPLNTSRNNTGLEELPPAQPAFISYPYGEARDWPQFGSGGRTAMAGPVLRARTLRSRHAMALPDYYEGRLFIYDWIRDWVFVVSMDGNGRIDAVERFLGGEKFAAPIDMELGPDGRLYILEYGKGWFVKNPDAALTRIDFRGR